MSKYFSISEFWSIVNNIRCEMYMISVITNCPFAPELMSWVGCSILTISHFFSLFFYFPTFRTTTGGGDRLSSPEVQQRTCSPTLSSTSSLR